MIYNSFPQCFQLSLRVDLWPFQAFCGVLATNEGVVIVIESLHHIGICVTDLARAKAFYGGVLGLRELPRPPFDFGGAWYELGDRELHLIVHPPTRTLRGTRDIDSRDGHLAIRVRSYDDTVQHLRSHGIDCLESPRNLTPWAQIYVTDPDGNVVEFNTDAPDS